MQQKTIFLIVFCSFFTLGIPQTPLPQGFTEVKKLIPDLEIDLRYATSNNFIGQTLDAGNIFGSSSRTSQGGTSIAYAFLIFDTTGA